jgi:hypothetical protein
MLSSQLSALLKARNDMAFYTRNQALHNAPVQIQPATLAIAEQTIYSNGQRFITPVLDEFSNTTATAPPTYSCSASQTLPLLTSLFLQWLAQSGLGPTHVARRIYLYSVLVAAAWNWTTPVSEKRIGGVKDAWDWSAGTPLASANDRSIWTLHVAGSFLSDIVNPIDPVSVYAYEREQMHWSVEKQATEVDRVLQSGNFTAFQTAWAAWIVGRNADGSTSLPVPTSAQIANLALQIATDSPTLPAFADVNGWTPLKLPMKPAKQGYLTFYWNTVRSTGLTTADEADISGVASVFVPDETERAVEVGDVVDITATLTDAQKCTAEFWAGGPNTVTPPGMFLWFWKEYVRSVNVSADRCVYSLLDLGIHLFEASRLVWGLKGQYVQARPIQEIRRRYAGETLIGYDGEGVSGELWMPYQEADFVTPPFADFPSGHSAFSQMFANVMKGWFGEGVPAGGVSRNDLWLLSPLFKRTDSATQTGFGSVQIAGGRSLVQVGTVPAASVTLSWNTWQAMADSAGTSRLYGGIHCLSAHQGSQALANEAHERIDDVWAIRRA